MRMVPRSHSRRETGQYEPLLYGHLLCAIETWAGYVELTKGTGGHRGETGGGRGRMSQYPDDPGQAVRLIAAATGVTAGLDSQVATELNAEAQEILKRHMAVMREAKFETSRRVECPACGERVMIEMLDVPMLTKSVGALMKAVDVNTRLMAFVQGKPDGRLEVVGGGGGQEWLKLLTEAQLEIVQGWIVENGRPAQIVEVVSDAP